MIDGVKLITDQIMFNVEYNFEDYMNEQGFTIIKYTYEDCRIEIVYGFDTNRKHNTVLKVIYNAFMKESNFKETLYNIVDEDEAFKYILDNNIVEKWNQKYNDEVKSDIINQVGRFILMNIEDAKGLIEDAIVYYEENLEKGTVYNDFIDELDIIDEIDKIKIFVKQGNFDIFDEEILFNIWEVNHI